MPRKDKAADRHYHLEHKAERNALSTMWYMQNRDKARRMKRDNCKKIKLEVLTHYSVDDSPRCAHCGVTDMDVLCIDHINNDGSKHRKTIGAEGFSFYYWLKRNDYPKGFQVLCANCNLKKLRVEQERRAASYAS